MTTDTNKADVANKGNKIGRNEPCPCGSGVKFKKCCLDKFEKEHAHQHGHHHCEHC